MGCFEIEFDKPVDLRKISEDQQEKMLNSYEQNIKNCLNKIENLSELEINDLNPIFRGSFNRKSDCYSPSSDMGDIAFKLYIPKKVQSKKELCKDFNGEHFKVFIIFGYEMPVWYIFPISENKDKDRNNEPSSSVVIVREYLKKTFNKLNIPFHTIGPSPFHCDFYISPAEDLKFKINKSESYDKIIIETPESDSVLLLLDLTSKLSFYYDVVFSKMLLWDEQGIADTTMKDLIDMINKNDFSPFIYFSRVKLSKKLNLELLYLKKSYDFQNREILNSLNSDMDEPEFIIWNEYVNVKIQDTFSEVSLDIESYDRVLNYSKDLGSKTFDIYKSLFVGIVLTAITIILSTLLKQGKCNKESNLLGRSEVVNLQGTPSSFSQYS